MRARYCGIGVIAACVGLASFCAAASGKEAVWGRVAQADGAPAVGAQMFLIQDRRARGVVAGPDGEFRFDDLAFQYLEVVAYKEGWAVSGYAGLPPSDESLNLVLPPADTLEIRVVSNNFLPVPGARVAALWVNDLFPVSVIDLAEAGFPLLRSDDAGILTLPMMPRGGFVKLTLLHHRYAESNVAYLPVGERRRDIVLYEGTRVRGRVTASGASLPEARVFLFQTGVGGLRRFAESRTDAEGFYHMRAPEDTYLIAAHHPDYATSLPVPVDLRDRNLTVSVDVEMLPPFRLRGSVVFPDASPSPAVRVVYWSGEYLPEEGLTNLQGQFQLLVSGGEGTLRILPPPGWMTETLADIPISFGEIREVRLSPVRLKELPVIRGRARLPEGVPPARLLLYSRDLPVPVHALTDPEGAFELQLYYQPEQASVTFRLEHPLRLLRRDFVVNLAAPGSVEVLLEPFEPDLEQRPDAPGRNRLTPLHDKPAPEIECSDWFNTQKISPETMRGKVVVLLFWGGFDDSPEGMNALSEFSALHEALRGQDDVLFLGIHDASSEPDEIEEYLHRYNLSFPVGRDADPFVTFVRYGINVIPQVVLLDKQGNARYTETTGRLPELIKALRRGP